MRRSTTVTLTLLSGVAAAVLAACRNDSRQCVDAADRAVPDSLCANRERDDAARTRTGVGGVLIAPTWYPYRYYYGGSGYRGIGSVLRGGSYVPSRSYSPSRSSGGSSGGSRSSGGSSGGSRSSGGSPIGTGTARGGFGGIGSGHGGFGHA